MKKTGLLAIVIGITLIFAFTACLDVVKDIAGEETSGWSSPSSPTTLSSGYWTYGNFYSYTGEAWYAFYASSGGTYYVWCNDYDGTNTF